MAGQNTGKLIPARASCATTQTIEEIEARVAELDRIEHAALRVLVNVMRELATQITPESRLPLRLAQSARVLSHWTSGGDVCLGLSCAMDDLEQNLEHDWPNLNTED